MNPDPIKNVNIEKIATEGSMIYESIKAQYEPKDNGKFLAIDIDSKKAYLGDTSAQAVEKARAEHPGHIFYVTKVAFDVAEMIAKSLVHRR